MSYAVKELYYTLQGEGAQCGRGAVFCRFTGCNLWTGREADRRTAVCDFCDTDFVGTDGPGGGKFSSAADLTAAILACWNEHVAVATDTPRDQARLRPYIVFTGGEPLLQLDADLIDRLHEQGSVIAVETNGTIAAPSGIDWLCVSPKAGAELVQRSGDELKLVYPQTGLQPENLEQLPFQHFFLQPMDGPQQAENIRATVEYCLAHPRWRLSLQMHKLLGLR